MCIEVLRHGHDHRTEAIIEIAIAIITIEIEPTRVWAIP